MADKTVAGENTANGQIPNGGATAVKSPMQANLVMGSLLYGLPLTLRTGEVKQVFFSEKQSHLMSGWKQTFEETKLLVSLHTHETLNKKTEKISKKETCSVLDKSRSRIQR